MGAQVAMSALPPKADIECRSSLAIRLVRFGSKADLTPQFCNGARFQRYWQRHEMKEVSNRDGALKEQCNQRTGKYAGKDRNDFKLAHAGSLNY